MAHAHAQLPPLPLPEGITSSYIDCTATTGLNVHILTSGTNDSSNPLLLFGHGFPELAYSWRKILPYFGSRGYFAVAFDQRGYGRTTGWDGRSHANLDMTQFGPGQNVIDLLALVSKLGRSHVDVVIGHDYGAFTAASCALTRPDFFRACVLMSHPFDSVPNMPGPESTSASQEPGKPKSDPNIQQSLAAIGLKHYKWANSTSTAAQEWERPAQGLTAFLRGYFYVKSGSDTRNAPHALEAWTADELAKMPRYYVQKLQLSMAETIAEETHGQDVSTSTAWLSDADLAIYVDEWTRTGFQGALNFYRTRTEPAGNRDMLLFAGKKIDVPTLYISGSVDWGNYQKPGALQDMVKTCNDFRGTHFIEDAGHWVQQEKPDQVIEGLEEFLRSLGIGRL